MASGAINLGGSVVGGIISGISARKKKKELEAQANWLRGRDINEQSYYQDKLGNATTDYLAPRGKHLLEAFALWLEEELVAEGKFGPGAEVID